MLSTSLTDKLNTQITLEIYSSNLYLQMSAWAISQGLPGCGLFLRQHSDQEKDHMQRLFDYVNETGAMARLGESKAPPSDFNSIIEVFEETYRHECLITKEINALVNAAFEEKDYSTFQFLQWYVSEQHEEEHLFSSILDRIKQIGTEGRSLFFIDQEMEKLAKSTPGV